MNKTGLDDDINLFEPAALQRFFTYIEEKDELRRIRGIKLSGTDGLNGGSTEGQDQDSADDDDADMDEAGSVADRFGGRSENDYGGGASGRRHYHGRSIRLKNDNAKKRGGPRVIENGRYVAARDRDTYILCIVSRYNRKTKAYVCEDADDEEENQGVLHEIPREFVLPLPTEEGAPALIPVGAAVLAMFPSTTAFYRGTVRRITRRGRNPEYQVHFEDDLVNGQPVPRKVPFNRILQLSED